MAEKSAAATEAPLVECDVADSAAVERIVEKAASEFGRLDIAVSNAAYSDREPFYAADLDGFRRTVDVTLWGAFNLLRSATRKMIAQGDGGSIILVSSCRMRFSYPPLDGLQFIEGGRRSDGDALAAIELVDYRIRVNTIHPGWIDTPGERKFASEEQIAKAGMKLPWKRLGRGTKSPAASFSSAIRRAITLPVAIC